jgi:cysteine desulfurase family protein (TIGR01976 family)
MEMDRAAAAPFPVASTEQIRSDFPALERRIGAHAVAYFDGPGGTQVPRAVGEAVLDYLYHHNANTHWEYPTSAETDEALARARRVFATLLNGAPNEIVFGTNMTTLTFHLARALGRGWAAGDEIVVTELDHHANIAPWTALEADRGVTVRWGRLDVATGELDLDQVLGLVTERTKLVAIGAASNGLGTITDLAPVVAAARNVGALVFVDGVHYTPHALPDVQALGCDVFACSPYKFYGPHVGVLWGRADLLARVEFPRLVPASNEVPERAETGTLCHEGIVGAAAAVEWLGSLAEGSSLRERLGSAYGALHRRGAALFATLWDELRGVPGVGLFGPGPDRPRTPTAALVVDGVRSSDVARHLARSGVFVSHGDFYARTVVERLGLLPEGLVRAGCACYTTEEEIGRLVAGIREIAGRKR